MDSTFHVLAEPGDRVIFTTVTAYASTVTDWIRTVNNAFHFKRTAVFGLDVEWKPGRRPNAAENPVATLQICAGDRCLIIQLLHLDRIPRSLRRFLTNPKYQFAGVDIGRDAVRLQCHHGLTCGNLYDVREEALLVSPQRERLSHWPGLQELAREVAEILLEKPMHLTLSNWEEEELCDEQVTYACLDAYASCRIGVTLFFNLEWNLLPVMIPTIL